MSKINYVQTKDLMSRSRLPSSDYVINPYVGCLHGCKYCYACFMKKYTGHDADIWGEFIDVKVCENPLKIEKLKGKSLFMSSVTDCYNPLEKKELSTRKILEQLTMADCELTITTKSDLVVRDIDLLKKIKNVTVAISINTLDEEFQRDMDRASSITSRIEALEKLHNAGIRTVVFMSPIFPEITDFKAIIERTKDFVDEYWFENLKLRGEYRTPILRYIRTKYPELGKLYNDIFLYGDKSYWANLEQKFEDFCQKEKIKYQNYFYQGSLHKKD